MYNCCTRVVNHPSMWGSPNAKDNIPVVWNFSFFLFFFCYRVWDLLGFGNFYLDPYTGGDQHHDERHAKPAPVPPPQWHI